MARVLQAGSVLWLQAGGGGGGTTTLVCAWSRPCCGFLTAGVPTWDWVLQSCFSHLTQ